jgi:putative ABC transport system permease protein
MIVLRNIAHNKFRTLISIAGVFIAVISAILLGSIGNGLLVTGEKTLDASTMQMWLTGKTVDLQSQYLGGNEGKITESHSLSEDLNKNEDIVWASPLLTELVYAYKEGDEPKAIFGLGLEGTDGPMVSLIKGNGLTSDTHFNNGVYNGPWKREVMIDARAAKILGIDVGDTLNIGKTLTEAKNQKFSVIGITNSLSSFTSGPMIVFYLSELQDLTGNNYYDSVNLVMIRVKDVSKVDQISQEIVSKYPEYTVSTNRNLIGKIARQNSTVLASAFSIVLLAVIMGMLLVINIMLLSLNERKFEIGILKVLGFSRWSIFKIIGLEVFLICLSGGSLAVYLSIPISEILNDFVYKMIGFNGLVIIDRSFLYVGMGIAIIMGFVSSFLAVIRINGFHSK